MAIIKLSGRAGISRAERTRATEPFIRPRDRNRGEHDATAWGRAFRGFRLSEAANARLPVTRAGGKIPLLVAFGRIGLLTGFALVALPIGYAATFHGGPLGVMLGVAWHPTIMLPASANALVVISAFRLQGRLDRKIAIGLTRVLLVHGALSFLILALRLPYSNQVMLTAALVSCVLAPLVVWLANDGVKARIAAVGPWHPLMDRLEGRFDWIEEPRSNLLDYDLILTPDMGLLPVGWSKVLSNTMLMGRPVRHLAEFIEEVEGRTCLEHFDPQHVQNRGLTSYRTRKRIMDVALVVIALPVAVPLLAAACVVIAVTMGRPVLFVQERVGLGGRVFRMYKLRTMRPALPNETAAATNSSNADRVTPAGRLFRKYRIDELPQLWNVLAGDMSIIGPRPEWRLLSEAYSAELPTYSYRYLVRPGITGWAQVRGGYASDLAETRAKVELDLFYIKNFSFALDVQILIRTIWTLASGFGAR
ncbi:sugar transferase [Brevundimonas fluminis]|uniref:sugar transferase n=1 Tax=Brevundimonas fluminis TaxID=2487274 RepID=UPI000F656989|nr:sugar transferase [Brevundimonas fluminis]